MENMASFGFDWSWHRHNGVVCAAPEYYPHPSDDAAEDASVARRNWRPEMVWLEAARGKMRNITCVVCELPALDSRGNREGKEI